MGRDSLKGPASEYIAGELRAQRARIGMTIEQLVEASGVKRGTVMRTLSGDAAIAVDVLIPVALAMGVDPGELLNEAREIIPATDPAALDLAAHVDPTPTDRERFEAEHGDHIA